MCVLGTQRTSFTWTMRIGDKSMYLMSLGESTMELKPRLVSGPGTMDRYGWPWPHVPGGERGQWGGVREWVT